MLLVIFAALSAVACIVAILTGAALHFSTRRAPADKAVRQGPEKFSPSSQHPLVPGLVDAPSCPSGYEGSKNVRKPAPLRDSY